MGDEGIEFEFQSNVSFIETNEFTYYRTVVDRYFNENVDFDRYDGRNMPINLGYSAYLDIFGYGREIVKHFDANYFNDKKLVSLHDTNSEVRSCAI